MTTTSDDPTSSGETASFVAVGEIGLFGHDPSTARVTLFPRSLSWRTRRAVLYVLLGVAIAPVVALLPPHAVWLIGALTAGGVLAWRSFNTRWVVEHLDGSCPRCSAPVSLKKGTRFKQPHPISCVGCQHELALHVDAGQLPAEG